MPNPRPLFIAPVVCLLGVIAPGVLPDAAAQPSISVERKHWFQDAFPSNETISTSTFGGWDTTSAWIRTGLNLAQLTGNTSRQDLPGDSVVCDAPLPSGRIDLVFRIYPGVGNHVQVGNQGSGLRRVPTATTPAVANAASDDFWESFLADNGALGTGGDGVSGPGHPGGVWDRHRWNSARCDTAEINLFPADGRLANLPGIVPGRYASMYHEADPKFATLGVPKNRCFLVNPGSGSTLDDSNITCGSGTYPPPWATPDVSSGFAVSEGGLAPGVTREFTQIIPDGQLTPGAHVQYFLRLSDTGASGAVLAMNPDTNVVFPQPGGSWHGSRWARLAVLPDRWKDPAFGIGGIGMACMLVADLDGGDVEQIAWTAIADSIGGTAPSRRGAHNGWFAPPGADPNDPGYFVRAHGGQAGSVWDLYRVQGSEDTLTGNAGALGGRGAPRCSGCPSSGRESRQGPTGSMLRNYRILMLLTGDRDVAILGPIAERGQGDTFLIQDYLTLPGGTFQPRMLTVIGNGFAEAESQSHPLFLSSYLRAFLRAGDYASFSGNGAPSVTLATTWPPPAGTLDLVSNSLDVLGAEITAPAGSIAATYPAGGCCAPYGASVHAPESFGRPFKTLLDGWRIQDLSRLDPSARQSYFSNLLANSGFACFPPRMAVEPSPTPAHSWLSLANNPSRSGAAVIRLRLAAAATVEVVVQDIAGRLVRVIAGRPFGAGEHEVGWDGNDVAGRPAPTGVYVVRVSAGNLSAAKTLVMLR